MFLPRKLHLKMLLSLVAILLSLTAFSANAHHTKKHHRRNYNDILYIHEVYVFNPRPVTDEKGKVIHNDVQFNPQPIINVPPQRCDGK